MSRNPKEIYPLRVSVLSAWGFSSASEPKGLCEPQLGKSRGEGALIACQTEGGVPKSLMMVIDTDLWGLGPGWEESGSGQLLSAGRVRPPGVAL